MREVQRDREAVVIEPWMREAAEHIHKLRMGSLEVQFKMGLGATHPNLSNTEQSQMAQQLTIDAIARVLATHAPDSATVPIGPGDVVQFKVAYTPPGYILQFDEHSTMFNSAEVVIVDAVQMGGAVVEGLDHDPIPFDLLTRIGRAVCWPDGSKVEEGK